MRTINPIQVLDGNAYLVADAGSTAAVSADFDNIYNQTGEASSLDDIFNSVAAEYGVDVKLLKAVAQAESGFDTNAVSCCGAMGIMQLMPTTAQSLEVEDPFDARQNITGGAKMLAYLLDDYNGNITLALAAYNAGSGSVQKYGGVPPYDETLGYIKKINDILGGALEHDSRTIEGAQKTNLSSAADEAAPDAAIKGSAAVMQAANTIPIGMNRYSTAGTASLAYLTTGSAKIADERLFDYEDYAYFKETVEQLLQKLTGQDAENTAGVTGLSAEKLPEGVPDISAQLLGTSIANQGLYSAVSQGIEGIMKNSPQSLYEAQASVISPLIAQMQDNYE